MITIQVPPLVPSWVYEGTFPEADEDRIANLAQAWDTQGKDCVRDADAFVASFNRLPGTWTGRDADAAGSRARNIVSLLQSTGTACSTLASACTSAQGLITVMKLTVNLVLARLAIVTQELILAGAASPATVMPAMVQIRANQLVARSILTSYKESVTANLSGLVFGSSISPQLPGMGGSGGAAHAIGGRGSEESKGRDGLFPPQEGVDFADLTGASDHDSAQAGFGPKSPEADLADQLGGGAGAGIGEGAVGAPSSEALDAAIGSPAELPGVTSSMSESEDSPYDDLGVQGRTTDMSKDVMGGPLDLPVHGINDMTMSGPASSTPTGTMASSSSTLAAPNPLTSTSTVGSAAATSPGVAFMSPTASSSTTSPTKSTASKPTTLTSSKSASISAAPTTGSGGGSGTYTTTGSTSAAPAASGGGSSGSAGGHITVGGTSTPSGTGATQIHAGTGSASATPTPTDVFSRLTGASSGASVSGSGSAGGAGAGGVSSGTPATGFVTPMGSGSAAPMGAAAPPGINLTSGQYLGANAPMGPGGGAPIGTGGPPVQGTGATVPPAQGTGVGTPTAQGGSATVTPLVRQNTGGQGGTPATGTGHTGDSSSASGKGDVVSRLGGPVLGAGIAAMSLTPLLGALHDLRLPIHPNRTLMQPTQFGLQDVPLAPLPADMDVVFQKVLAPGEAEAMMAGTMRTVRGMVYPRDQITHLLTPADLFDALGLGYTVTNQQGKQARAFDRYAGSVEVLRCNGVRQRDLIVPLDQGVSRPGSPFATMVRDHARPWLGSGEAPGSSAAHPIEEFEVLGLRSVAIPHLAEIWRMDDDGTEHHVSTYNARSGLWSGTTGEGAAVPGRKVDNGLYAVMDDGNGYETVTLTETHSVLVAYGVAAPEEFIVSPDGSHRLVVSNYDIADMVGVASVARWRNAEMQVLNRYGQNVLVDYADGSRAQAQALGFGQIAQGHWAPQWVPFADLTDVREVEHAYPVPRPASAVVF